MTEIALPTLAILFVSLFYLLIQTWTDLALPGLVCSQTYISALGHFKAKVWGFNSLAWTRQLFNMIITSPRGHFKNLKGIPMVTEDKLKGFEYVEAGSFLNVFA